MTEATGSITHLDLWNLWDSLASVLSDFRDFL